MNYKAFGRFIPIGVVGIGLWYLAGFNGYDSTPDNIVRDARRRGMLEAIVVDANSTNTLPGALGKMFTYAGFLGAGISVFVPGKKEKKEE